MREIKLIKYTDSNYPKKLLEIENYPKELYVIGNEKLLEKNSIGIVGARESTGYGEKCARNFAREISKTRRRKNSRKFWEYKEKSKYGQKNTARKI